MTLKNPVRSYLEPFDRADDLNPPDDQRLLVTMMLFGIAVVVLIALALDPTMGGPAAVVIGGAIVFGNVALWIQHRNAR